jgi:GNAT superfamily N-acetyltransferase
MRLDRPPPVRPLSITLERGTAAFTCGVRRIDAYLQNGLAIQNANLARVFVALEPANKTQIIGFYAIHNMHIEAQDVPNPFGAALRRDSVVGAIYIVMFAVASQWQNRGVGAALFAHALRRAKQVAIETGTWAVVLDALDDRAELFYRRFGFETLVGGTRRLFLQIDAIAL